MKKRPPRPGKAKHSSTRRPRRKLVPASEEMRRWSAIIETEIRSWPEITTKPMFGFESYYRVGQIFAAIPRTRGFGTPSSFMLKFDPMPAALFLRAQKEPRLNLSTRVTRKGWFGFELSSGDDIRDALWWLAQAHDCIRQSR